MAYVMFRVGDLFERGGDLTVLPCSAKSHISSTAEAHVQKWGLSLPPEIPLGKIDISPFPHKKRITHYLAWAASVMNYKSSPNVIRNIGQLLGEQANRNPQIQIIESPLLGAGTGQLDPVVAGTALREGFLATCRTDAILIIYGQMATIVQTLRRVHSGGNAAGGRSPSGPAPGGAPLSAPLGRSGMPKMKDVFVSYSRKDKRSLDELSIHLKPFQRAAKISVWSDKEIRAGSDWNKEIADALRSAKVAVLLVTPSFLASDFIQDQELAPLLKKAETGGVTILWIPVRTSSYTTTDIGKYQALWPPDNPVAEMKSGRDHAWVKVCKEIEWAIRDHPAGATP